MEKCVIVSDSFKGTLTSSEIASIFEIEVKKVFPSCKVSKVIIADGGEGTLEAFSSQLEGKIVHKIVKDAYFKDIDASYFISKENVAIIEVAKVIGLPLIAKKDPSITSSFGVGELILDAINKKCKKIVIGLGGSSTNDAGLGIACALKAKFYDNNHNEFIPVGSSLDKIVDVDLNEFNQIIKDVKIIGMSDVTNIMHGINGASYCFARQKGADDKMIKLLDDNLIYLDKFYQNKLHMNVSNIKGTGAAGAIGSLIVSLLKGKLVSGIETILDLVDFDRIIEDANYVFTGEGKVDFQSFNGKVIDGVIRRCKNKNIPVILVSGSVSEEIKDTIANNKTIVSSYVTSNGYKDFETLKAHSRDDYRNTIKRVLTNIK